MLIKGLIYYFILLKRIKTNQVKKRLIATRTTLSVFSFIVILFSQTTLLVPQSCFANLSSEIEQITGNRTKIVFARCLAGDGNLDLTTPDYSLIGFDTYRNDFFEIVSGPRYCANPVITPDGNAVLFSDLKKNEVHIVPWCGTADRIFTSGYGLCVQRDTSNGIDWIYVSDSAYGNYVKRYNLSDTSQSEMIWNKTRVSIRFTVSGDGRFAGGEFPWPIVGEVSLPNNKFTDFGSGCNAAIAPDNSYRLFHMDGNHKSIWMYDSNGMVIKQILFNTIPEIKDYATWIPRWSNDARFMTLTAPCQPNPKTQMEDIFLGCFNEAHDSITKWIQITNTPDSLENYAYAWIGKKHYVKLDKYSIDFIRKENGISTECSTITVSSSTGSLHDCNVTVSETWLTVKPVIQDGKIILENTIDSTELMDQAIHSALVTITCTEYVAELYRVNLIVEDTATPVSLKIAPNNQFISQFDSLQFSATCLDQFKTKLSASCEWSSSGGGTINENGMFISNGDTGNFIVRVWLVSSPIINDSTTITIYETPRILVPDSNTVNCIGDSLYINWVSHISKFKNLMVYLSINGGRNWKLLNADSAIYSQYNSSGSYIWAIPPSIRDMDPSAKDADILSRCKIKITDYQNEIQTVSEKTFTIKCDCTGSESIQSIPESALYITPSDKSITIAVFSLAGKLVYRVNQNTENTCLKSLPKGIYLLKVISPQKIVTKKILKW